jgi:hypothetical protein
LTPKGFARRGQGEGGDHGQAGVRHWPEHGQADQGRGSFRCEEDVRSSQVHRQEVHRTGRGEGRRDEVDQKIHWESEVRPQAVSVESEDEPEAIQQPEGALGQPLGLEGEVEVVKSFAIDRPAVTPVLLHLGLFAMMVM